MRVILTPAEFDRLHPKVRFVGKVYRVHKHLAGDLVRLVTLNGENTVDVHKDQIEAAR